MRTRIHYCLWEPTKDELADMDERMDLQRMCSPEEIKELEFWAAPSLRYLDELAMHAWLYFVNARQAEKDLPKEEQNKNIFIDSVHAVLPQVSSLHHDAREIMSMMRHEVASRLSIMFWQSRWSKAAQKERRKEIPREKRSDRMARYRREMLKIVPIQHDLLLDGMKSGVSETPITALPEQKTVLPIGEHVGINLVIPLIDAEAHFEQKRLGAHWKSEFAHLRADGKRRKAKQSRYA